MLKVHTILGVFLLLALAACQEEIRPVEGPERLVVDGWITDQPGPFIVKLSTTEDFNAKGLTPRVAGAVVEIADDQGIVYLLDQEISPGTYQTFSDTLSGEVGRSYTLRVTTSQGKQYQSKPELLRPVASIEEVFSSYRVNFNPISLNPNFELSNSVIITYTDPVGQGDFYRWKFYLNDNFQNNPESLILGNDRIEDGNQRQLEVGDLGFFFGGRLRVEQLSLTEEAHDFLALLRSQTVELGGTFGVAPAPIIGNMQNVTDPNEIVLGYFGASSISNKEIVL